MSKAWLIVLQIGIYAVGVGMVAIAYYWAQDFAPIYFALFMGGTSLIGFGSLFVQRRLRNPSPMLVDHHPDA